MDILIKSFVAIRVDVLEVRLIVAQNAMSGAT